MLGRICRMCVCMYMSACVCVRVCDGRGITLYFACALQDVPDWVRSSANLAPRFLHKLAPCLRKKLNPPPRQSVIVVPPSSSEYVFSPTKWHAARVAIIIHEEDCLRRIFHKSAWLPLSSRTHHSHACCGCKSQTVL